MRVTIHDAAMALVSGGRVERSRVVLERRAKLSPRGQYTIRLYREPDEPVRAWKPEDRPDVLVLERTDDRAQLEPEPPAGTTLAYRIRFEVDNDGALPKLVRWRFQSEQDEDATSWRVPLVVRASARRQLTVVGSFALALWLSEIYETFVESTRLRWPNLAVATIGALGMFVAGMAFWRFLGWAWTPRD